MRHNIVFYAKGHPNILCLHENTVMITKENYLTKRGDCIAAINSEKSLADLPLEFKKLASKKDAIIKMSLEVDNKSINIKGKGHPELTFKHPYDIVARKSDYLCDRTLMVLADKAASDLDRGFVRLIQDRDKKIRVELSTTL